MWQEGILTKIIQGITYNEEVKMVFMHPDIYATYQTTVSLATFEHAVHVLLTFHMYRLFQ